MEYYDPNSNVCQNQDDFNEAFRKAIKHNNKKNMKDAQPWVWVLMSLYIIFFIWAIILASKVQDPQQRVVHMTLALVFAPAYVLGYYLGAFGNKAKHVLS